MGPSWTSKRLEELLARPLAYGVLKPGEFVKGGVPLVRIQDLYSGRLNPEKMHRISTALHREFRRTTLVGGELLLSIVGTLGKVVEVPQMLAGANISRALCVLHPSAEVERDFLKHTLTSLAVQQWIKKEGRGNAQAVINLGILRRLVVPIPALSEQRKIADILSSVDEVIEKTEGVIEQLQIVKKAMMQELLMRGLPSRHTRFKKTEIGEMPEEWELAPLSDVAEFLDGRRVPIKSADRDAMRGDIPYYGASGIIDWVNRHLFDEPLVLLAEDGANILSRSTPVAFKVDGKCWVNNHAHVLRPREGCDRDFLVEWLEFLDYEEFSTGTAQPKLNQAVCQQIPVPRPPLDEQVEIGRLASALIQRRNCEQTTLKQLHTLKSALSSVLLTGEIRITTDTDAA